MTHPLRWSFVAGSHTASRYYRAELMAKGLNDLGHDAKVWPVSFEGDDGTIRGWDNETGEWDQEPANVVVARLHGPPPAGELFVKARRAGQVICFELDDDVWAFRDWNPPVARKNANDPAREMALAAMQVNMACADVCVASTPTLAQVMCQVLDGIGEDVPVAFVRSPVETQLGAPLDGSPARVGWLGTWAYRGRDLTMILEPLRKALGDGAGMLRHLGRDRGEPPLPVFLLASDPDGQEPSYPIHEHDWVDVTNLPPLLRGLDLAVIPSEPHRFNSSRSATTGLALAACGVPYIASPTPEYAHLAEQGCGLTADDGWEWATMLGDLVNDLDLRRKFGQSAREVAGRLYTPELAAREWVRIVEAL